MTDFDPATFGRRLKVELDRLGWDVKTLQQHVAKQVTGPRMGTSYGSVWSYVNGQAPREPRRETVEAMAVSFGVRADYLLFGGPRTDAEARLQREAEASEGADLYDQVRAQVPGLAELDYAVAAALMTYLHRWVRANIRVGLQVSTDEVADYIASVWDWAHEPFRAWARRTGRDPLDLDPYGASDYMMAVLHALNFSLQVAQPPTAPDTSSSPSQED